MPLRGEAGGAGKHADRRERTGTAPIPRGFEGLPGVEASQLDDRQRGLPLLRRRGEELAVRLGGDRADELQISAQQPEAQHSHLELSEASRAVERGDGRMGCNHPVDLSPGRTIGLRGEFLGNWCVVTRRCDRCWNLFVSGARKDGRVIGQIVNFPIAIAFFSTSIISRTWIEIFPD